jgi:hypothetical protein
MAASRPAKRPAGGDDDLHKRLNAAHAGLLRVHKAVLDHERTRYERVNPPIEGPLKFLKLALEDPWFAWLRPVSELIVQIDEFVSAKEPTDPRQGEALLKQARDMLTPDETGGPFARAYHRAVQESPEVAMAHGEWRRANT